MGHNKVHIKRITMSQFEDAIDSYVPKVSRTYEDEQDSRRKRLRTRSPSPKRRRSLSPSPRRRPRSLTPEPSLCVMMSDMPVRVEKDDVVNFFRPTSIGNLYIEYNNGGDCLGNAYVEFLKYFDAENATRIRRKLKGCQLQIKTITKSEMNAKIAEHKNTFIPKGAYVPKPRNSEIPRTDVESKPKNGDYQKDSESKKHQKNDKEQEETFPVKLHGLPWEADTTKIKKFFKELDIPSQRIHLVQNFEGRTNTDGFIEFSDRAHAEIALKMDMQYMGKRYINVTPVTKDVMVSELKVLRANEGTRPQGVFEYSSRGGRGGFRGRGGRGGIIPSQRKGIGAPPEESPPRDAPGIVMRLQNVPFAAGAEEIMGFLADYNPIPGFIRIHYNDDGEPTGNVLVSFENHRAAARVMKEVHGQRLRGRNINVFYT